MSAGEIVVGGRRFPCAVPVVSWHISGLAFPDLPMRDSADLVVLRCTGTDSLAAVHYKALRTKLDRQTGKPLGLSTCLFVDHKGIVHQFADVLARTSGVGNAGNKRGCVVDLANRFDPNETDRGLKRERVIETVNRESSMRTTITGPQLRSTLALAEALCVALGVPFAVPMRAGHAMADTMSAAELAAFKGVCGWSNLDPRRHDPGAYVLRAIAARSARAWKPDDVDQ
jgi:hypothetical protein